MKEVQRHQQGEEWEKCPKLLGSESTGVLGTGRDAGDISRGLGQPGAWGCGRGEGKETHCRQLTPNPKKESCRQGMMMTVRVRGRQRAVAGCWAGLGFTAGPGWWWQGYQHR